MTTMPATTDLPTLIDGAHRDRWEEDMRVLGYVPITMFTDGSCPENSRRPGEAPMGAGIVAVSSHIRKEWSIFLGGGTNIRAEMLAIQHGLLKLLEPERCALRLITDSEWSLGALDGSFKIKKNVELVAETRAILDRVPHRELIHVPGHNDFEGNERCDVLAGTAVRLAADWRGVWHAGAYILSDPPAHELNTSL
jgi:ribonuclease HI